MYCFIAKTASVIFALQKYSSFATLAIVVFGKKCSLLVIYDYNSYYARL